MQFRKKREVPVDAAPSAIDAGAGTFFGTLRSELDEPEELATEFADVAERYTRTRDSYLVGDIDANAFGKALVALRVVDADGHEWTMGATTGAWYRRTSARSTWAVTSPPAKSSAIEVAFDFDKVLDSFDPSTMVDEQPAGPLVSVVVPNRTQVDPNQASIGAGTDVAPVAELAPEVPAEPAVDTVPAEPKPAPKTPPTGGYGDDVVADDDIDVPDWLRTLADD